MKDAKQRTPEVSAQTEEGIRDKVPAFSSTATVTLPGVRKIILDRPLYMLRTFFAMAQ